MIDAAQIGVVVVHYATTRVAWTTHGCVHGREVYTVCDHGPINAIHACA